MCVFVLFNNRILILTIVCVPDTVLKDGTPLLLLLLGHHTEIIMTSIRVPEDERKLSRTFQEWRTANFSLHSWKTHDLMLLHMASWGDLHSHHEHSCTTYKDHSLHLYTPFHHCLSRHSLNFILHSFKARHCMWTGFFF